MLKAKHQQLFGKRVNSHLWRHPDIRQLLDEQLAWETILCQCQSVAILGCFEFIPHQVFPHDFHC